MSLIPKIEIVEVDSASSNIVVRDITGEYSIDNTGGYGGSNILVSNISDIIFTISSYDSNKVDSLRFVRTSDVNHPEYLTLPTINDITNGTPVNINSVNLNITKPNQGLKAFPDGVYDINMYVANNSLFNIVGNKGDSFVTSSTGGMDAVFNLYDGILIDNNIYTINRNIPSNANILYLEKPLKENATTFKGVYQGNVKMYSDNLGKKCIVNAVGNLSLEDCGCKKEEDLLFKYMMFTIAAQLEFDCGNYEKANDLLVGVYRGCGCLKCNC